MEFKALLVFALAVTIGYTVHQPTADPVEEEVQLTPGLQVVPAWEEPKPRQLYAYAEYRQVCSDSCHSENKPVCLENCSVEVNH